MAKFQVDWSKTYYHSGQEIVEGVDTQEEAEAEVQKRIGDLTGSSQYDPNEDYVHAVKIFQNIK